MRVRELTQAKKKTSSVLALTDGKIWITAANEKADCFAETFSRKNVMEALEINEYTGIAIEHEAGADVRVPDMVVAVKLLQDLDESSATGPDLVPTRILKRCAGALAFPIWLLAVSILRHGTWPTQWKEHWLTPLYKKKSVYEAGNYRGLHLTSPASKVVERFLGVTFMSRLHRICAFGPNQFAYLPRRGARGAFAFLVLTWLTGPGMGQTFAIYCPDASGAFD